MFRRIEIKTEDDLLPPGAKPGTIPTDIEQATGLERLELIGKMQGIDIFDMRPLDASRKGMFTRESLYTERRRPDAETRNARQPHHCQRCW
jgi:hypothetical protein